MSKMLQSDMCGRA